MPILKPIETPNPLIQKQKAAATGAAKAKLGKGTEEGTLEELSVTRAAAEQPEFDLEGLGQQALEGGLSQENITEAFGAYKRRYLDEQELSDYFNQFITQETVPGAPAEEVAGERPEAEAEDPFKEAKARLEEVFERRDAKVSDIMEAIKGLTETRQSAFDRLFGEESRISRFYTPALQAVEEQILDTEGLITSLRGGLEERLEEAKGGRGVTQAQYERIYGKERGALIDQFDKLVRSQTRLRAGLEVEVLLAGKEFDMIMKGAREGIEALKFELENSGFDQAEIDLITTELNQDLEEQMRRAEEDREIAREIRAEERAIEKETRQEKEQRTEDLQSILQNAMDFVLNAGVIPTENFQKVIDDAMKMLAEGKTLSEIQLAITRAIGENPQVRNYINTLFREARNKTTDFLDSGPDIDKGGDEDLWTPPTPAIDFTLKQLKRLGANV